jgi:hypothetical protein
VTSQVHTEGPVVASKSGHPQLSMHFCNIADGKIDCGVRTKKKLQNCNWGPSKFRFRDPATLSL